jgi:hypothetical protein
VSTLGVVGNMVEAFKTLRETQINIAEQDPTVSMKGAFSRGEGVGAMRQGIGNLTNGVAFFGILSDEQLRVFKALMGAVTVTYASMLIYQAVQALVNANLIYEAAQAAIETAAYVAGVVTIPFVVLAAATAGAVYAGLQFASGTWTIPSGATDTERRQILLGGPSNG